MGGAVPRYVGGRPKFKVRCPMTCGESKTSRRGVCVLVEAGRHGVNTKGGMAAAVRNRKWQGRDFGPPLDFTLEPQTVRESVSGT